MRGKRILAGAAALCLLAMGRAQAANPTHITFVTDWKAQAEHGGYYEALAQGLYKARGLDVKILEGGPSVNVPQLLAGGAADFGIGSNGFIPLNMLREGASIKAVMAIFQKDPQVLIAHPRRDVKSLADMKGKPIMIADASTVAFWPWLKAKYGYDDTQIRKYTFNLAPFLVDPKAIQEGYLTSEPYTIETTGRLQAANIPSRRQRLSRLCEHGAGAAEMDRRQSRRRASLCRCDARGLAQLSVRQSRPGQCADQTGQSGYDG